MPRRVLCKFFARGACLKGDQCQFSHDWKDEPSNVCRFYQKGLCSYGSHCRYDHVEVPQHHAPASSSSSSNACPHRQSNSNKLARPSRVVSSSGEHEQHPTTASDCATMNKPYLATKRPSLTSQRNEVPLSQDSKRNDCCLSSADYSICLLASSGHCPFGEDCTEMHGDLCSICGKECLNPYRPDEREKHMKDCHKNMKMRETWKLSQEIECSVCLERVLAKPTAAERKFGLLSECDHPFCIFCIRNWRKSASDSGIDVNAAVRACPVCRKLSYFVIPSFVWYSTKEEKQDIIDNYKAKLKSIDCKYFDFGSGTCPFGTKCFYKHTYLPQTSRPRGHRPYAYRPRMNRRSQLVIEEELEDLAGLFMAEEELLDLAGDLDVTEEFTDLDDEDVHNLLEMTFLLMQLGLGNGDSDSDDEI